MLQQCLEALIWNPKTASSWTERTISAPKLLQYKEFRRDKRGAEKNSYVINITHNILMAMAEVTSFADLIFFMRCYSSKSLQVGWEEGMSCWCVKASKISFSQCYLKHLRTIKTERTIKTVNSRISNIFHFTELQTWIFCLHPVTFKVHS